jgi:hypothetical protein
MIWPSYLVDCRAPGLYNPPAFWPGHVGPVSCQVQSEVARTDQVVRYQFWVVRRSPLERAPKTGMQ